MHAQVHNASFCLLTGARLSVNMYTLIGDGSHKPRLGVSVAPGTLIFHVLNNCQPVFITNIISFPGNSELCIRFACPTVNQLY